MINIAHGGIQDPSNKRGGDRAGCAPPPNFLLMKYITEITIWPNIGLPSKQNHIVTTLFFGCDNVVITYI